MEKEMAGDDKAKAILSGPLTLEKLASLSTLKVSGTTLSGPSSLCLKHQRC
jgi:hypothetical protein